MRPLPYSIRLAIGQMRLIYGRSYKTEIRLAWETGIYPDSVDSQALQQFRNEYGPRALNSLRPCDIEQAISTAHEER